MIRLTALSGAVFIDGCHVEGVMLATRQFCSFKIYLIHKEFA